MKELEEAFLAKLNGDTELLALATGGIHNLAASIPISYADLHCWERAATLVPEVLPGKGRTRREDLLRQSLWRRLEMTR